MKEIPFDYKKLEKGDILKWKVKNSTHFDIILGKNNKSIKLFCFYKNKLLTLTQIEKHAIIIKI